MKYSTLQRHARSLAGVSEAPHFNTHSYRVGGRIFMTVPPGETHVHVFVPDEARIPAIAAYPAFIEKLVWGAKVVGLRVALDGADTRVVKALVTAAWQAKAAKRANARSKGA